MELHGPPPPTHQTHRGLEPELGPPADPGHEIVHQSAGSVERPEVRLLRRVAGLDLTQPPGAQLVRIGGMESLHVDEQTGACFGRGRSAAAGQCRGERTIRAPEPPHPLEQRRVAVGQVVEILPASGAPATALPGIRPAGSRRPPELDRDGPGMARGPDPPTRPRLSQPS